MDPLQDLKDARDVVSKVKELMKESTEGTKEIQFHVGYMVKAIGELRDAIKHPPVRETDVDVRKHLSHLSKLAYFPFDKLAQLQSDIEQTNKKVRALIVASDHLFKEFGQPDVFSLRTFEALVHLNYIPNSFFLSRKYFGDALDSLYEEPPVDMLGEVELRPPTKMKEGDIYFGEW